MSGEEYEYALEYDGNLGCGIEVAYRDPVYTVSGPVFGVLVEECHGPGTVGLTPLTALALLAWLRKEETTLQRMAYEGETDHA